VATRRLSGDARRSCSTRRCEAGEERAPSTQGSPRDPRVAGALQGAGPICCRTTGPRREKAPNRRRGLIRRDLSTSKQKAFTKLTTAEHGDDTANWKQRQRAPGRRRRGRARRTVRRQKQQAGKRCVAGVGGQRGQINTAWQRLASGSRWWQSRSVCWIWQGYPDPAADPRVPWVPPHAAVRREGPVFAEGREQVRAGWGADSGRRGSFEGFEGVPRQTTISEAGETFRGVRIGHRNSRRATRRGARNGTAVRAPGLERSAGEWLGAERKRGEQRANV